MTTESTLTDADRAHLGRALDLAERGRAATRPNPVVGAVLVQDDEAIAEGWHARYGDAHAERVALDAWGVDRQVPEEATLYVTLEPCAHQGQQPPCAQLLIDRGVRRVVIACPDPTEKTRGIGPAMLAEAGIEVVWADGAIARKAAQQNAGFVCAWVEGRPYVTFKWAMTKDGALATGDPDNRWVSGEQSRAFVQTLRASSGAVAVGIDTVLADDPLLTVRGPSAAAMATPPLRVVYDRTLRMPVDCQLTRTLDQGPVLVICARTADAAREEAISAAGISVWRAPDSDSMVQDSLRELATTWKVNDLLLESGPRLAAAFWAAEAVDRLIVFTSAQAARPNPNLPRLPAVHPLRAAVAKSPERQLGEDTLRVAIIRRVGVPERA